jgi:hypothetical protein
MISASGVRSPMPGMYQIETLSQIVMGTKTLGNVACLRGLACLQPLDVAGDYAPQLRLIDMLEPGLEAGDVLLGLLKEGQISSQLGQSWIWRDPRLVERRRARRDQHCIERIVLGTAQMHPAKRLDLDRLQHQQDEAGRPQMLGWGEDDASMDAGADAR